METECGKLDLIAHIWKFNGKLLCLYISIVKKLYGTVVRIKLPQRFVTVEQVMVTIQIIVILWLSPAASLRHLFLDISIKFAAESFFNTPLLNKFISCLCIGHFYSSYSVSTAIMFMARQKKTYLYSLRRLSS